MKIVIFLLLIFVSISDVNSQSAIRQTNVLQDEFPNEETRFERLPAEFGISNASIRSMFQDDQGFMWFAITPGLARYDGQKIKTYGRTYLADTSYREIVNSLLSAFKDREGDVWIGTISGILVKYEKDFESFIEIEIEDDKYPVCREVRSISEDQNGEILIGGLGGGLRSYNKKTHSIKCFYNKNSGLLSNNINSVLVDKDGLIYIGTDDMGLFLFDQKNESFKNYQHNIENTSLCDNKVNCIYEDSNDNIWIGTENGLNIFDKHNKEFINFQNDPKNATSISNNLIRDIAEDKNNVIWIATSGGGLNKYEGNGIFTNFRYKNTDQLSLISDFTQKLFVDNSNVLWIGTPSNGVCKLDLEKKKFHTVSGFFKRSGLSKSADVTMTYEDSFGLFWVSTRNNPGIFVFKKNENNLLNFNKYYILSDELFNETYTSCFEDYENNLWFCSKAGKLIKFYSDNKSHKTYKFKDDIQFGTIFKNDSINILISTTSSKILKFNLKEKIFSELNPYSDTLRYINYDGIFFQDKEKNLWFNSVDDVFKYDLNKDKTLIYKSFNFDGNGFHGIWLSTPFEDSHGDMLFSSTSGLNRLVKLTNKFTFDSVEVTSCMLEDNSGNIWSGSAYDYGISKFNPLTKEFKHYTAADGIQANEFNYFWCNPYIKDRESNLYFGGPNGLTYFKPEEIRDNLYIPNIVLTDFQISNETIKPFPENLFLKKSITVTKEINLSYKENVFSFEFAALIFNNPSKNQCAYKMDGFDKDWVYCGTKRTATYTNLDPGEYTFRVKGSNNDGIWNEEGTSVKVIITPPWWQTLWFKSCGAVMIFLTAGYGYKKRINKLEREKKLQEDFSKKLLNSQEEERKKIASVLHDSIAHDVLITKNASVLGMKSSDESEKEKLFKDISEQSSSTLDELRRIQFSLHPYEIAKLGLTRAIKSIVDRVSKNTEIKFTFEEDIIDKLFSGENEIHIYRIIQEGINNIIKHSTATEALIKILRTDENVLISISDNGKGFVKRNALRKNSMGLSGISERVRLLGGSLEIDSERSDGTELRISLPVHKSQS